MAAFETIRTLAIIILVAAVLGCGHDVGTTAGDAGVPRVPVTTAIDAETAQEDTGDASDAPPPLPPQRGTDSVRWTDPAAVAREALERLRAANPADVLAISTRTNAAHRPQVIDDQSSAEAFFGVTSWRARSVGAWGGDIGQVRVLGDEAWVAFHELNEDGDERIAIVLLRREDDQWRLEDLRNPSRARFGRFGEILAFQ